MRGEGSAATKRPATAVAGEGAGSSAVQDPPIVHVWTDGCGKQYKGKRSFEAVARSLRALGVVIDHNFAATSHFKGAHDGIGGLAKNMIRRQEAQGRRIPDTKAAFDFLSDYAKSSGTKKGGPFADWSPYKITRMWVKEIPRPPVNLEGIPASSRLYQFMGGVHQEMCAVWCTQRAFSALWQLG